MEEASSRMSVLRPGGKATSGRPGSIWGASGKILNGSGTAPETSVGPQAIWGVLANSTNNISTIRLRLRFVAKNAFEMFLRVQST